MIEFGEWLPDQPRLRNPGCPVVKNVLPHSRGYIPFPATQTYSSALNGFCYGATYARDKNNNVVVYAGSATKLESLSTGGWTDVTRLSGGAYATTERWEFVQFGEDIIATNFVDDIQSITMGGANFAALGGTPPKARHITTARNFVLLGNLNDSGDGLVPRRVQWCALNDPTDWTASAVTQSDSEDLSNAGGWIHRLVGREHVLVYQERAITRMDYVGTPAVWSFDEIEPSLGLLAPGALVNVGQTDFFLSERGFQMLQSGARAEPIGVDRVDRFVLDDIDYSALNRITSGLDLRSHRLFWCYPGAGNNGGTPNKIVVYDYGINRWSYAEIDIQAILSAATPAYTLEELDSVSASLDALAVSLDSPAWQGGTPQLAFFDTSHQLGFFSGSPLTGSIETAEHELTPGARSLLTATRPLIDGGSTTVAIGSRNLQSSSIDWLPADSMRTTGRTTRRKNARYHTLRVAPSSSWTYAQGIDVDYSPVGWR